MRDDLLPQKTQAQGDHVIRVARQLADGNRPGVLATVDRDGIPQLRWMATLSLNEFPHLYALTSVQSRKVGQIQANPRVSWMFTNEASTMVVHLTGTATILTDNPSVNRIWRLIENKSQAYFLDLESDFAGLAVIDTVIENMECIAPRYDLHYPGKVEEGLPVDLNPA